MLWAPALIALDARHSRISSDSDRCRCNRSIDNSGGRGHPVPRTTRSMSATKASPPHTSTACSSGVTCVSSSSSARLRGRMPRQDQRRPDHRRACGVVFGQREELIEDDLAVPVRLVARLLHRAPPRPVAAAVLDRAAFVLAVPSPRGPVLDLDRAHAVTRVHHDEVGDVEGEPRLHVHRPLVVETGQGIGDAQGAVVQRFRQIIQFVERRAKDRHHPPPAFG